MTREKPDIRNLFEPRSVAVIGASTNRNKIGYKIVENILHSGYQGKVYPVNPRGGEVLGLQIYRNIEELPESPDLVTITIPAKYCVETVEACGRKGAKFLSIISSGFSEVGNSEEERQMVEIARNYGMRILGPNIFGFYSARARINASFGPKNVRPGSVAIITQSGALGIAIMGKTMTENIGLSAVVSVGNKSDLDEAELLDYLIDNEETKVILMYIEGIKNGGRLVPILKRATSKKPVVVLKSGRSKRGSMAAASHTGSLAGADGVFSDVMRQCGVFRAESVVEALNWCKYLADNPQPKGENAVIVTNGGGIGVMAADACEKYGVNLYDDVAVMKEAFGDSVPSFGSVKNPVDITGQASLQDYENCIRAAMEDDSVHSLICLGCETAVLDVENLTPTIERIFKENRTHKPMVFSFLGGREIEEGISKLKQAGVPIYSDVYEAVSCLGTHYEGYRRLLSPREDLEESKNPEPELDLPRIRAVIQGVRKEERHFLLANEARELMEAAGIPMPGSGVARSLEDALTLARDISYPVVLKIVSRDIIHKSDAGGVALDLQNDEELMDAYQAVLHNARQYNSRANIEGVEVCEMVSSGTETIIGASRDPSFGPVVMFGLGGIYVEVMKDVAFRAQPLHRSEALNMVSQIRSYPLLLGVRGEEQKDIEGIIDTIMRVAAIIQHCGDISDIEVNPLMAYEQGQGVKAVDARILLTSQKEASQ